MNAANFFFSPLCFLPSLFVCQSMEIHITSYHRNLPFSDFTIYIQRFHFIHLNTKSTIKIKFTRIQRKLNQLFNFLGLPFIPFFRLNVSIFSFSSIFSTSSITSIESLFANSPGIFCTFITFS